jgi:hypothetical protein
MVAASVDPHQPLAFALPINRAFAFQLLRTNRGPPFAIIAPAASLRLVLKQQGDRCVFCSVPLGVQRRTQGLDGSEDSHG